MIQSLEKSSYNLLPEWFFIKRRMKKSFNLPESEAARKQAVSFQERKNRFALRFRNNKITENKPYFT